MYGHTHSKSIDQPGKVVNPARGQLNRKNNIYLFAFAPVNLVSRDGFGSPVPRQPAHLRTQTESGAYLRDSSRVPRRRQLFVCIVGSISILRLNLVLAYGIPPEFRGGVNYLYV